jgi:formylglycine-generating enzyme required for sulfatase activity
VSATTVGTGTSGGVSPVTSGNFANYDFGADWNNQDGNVTTVGTNGGPSAYGAFDMSGNVTEWNDLTGAAGARGLRGGNWNNQAAFFLASSYRFEFDPSLESNSLGFRLASPASNPSGVPEIDPAGLGSVLALVTGALGLLERRRVKAA